MHDQQALISFDKNSQTAPQLKFQPQNHMKKLNQKFLFCVQCFSYKILMLYRYLQLFLFFLLEIAVNTLSAQELKYRSDIITRENGLSNSSVSCVIKDKYGFLWFGTWNGLNRFDGYEMTVFQSEVKDSSSISNSNINSFYEDNEGSLWIGTDNGLNCYDQITGKFKRYYFQDKNTADQRNDQINSITQDVQGILWVGCQEDGLISLDKSTGAFKQYTNDFSDRSNNVVAVLADNLNDQYLWLGTADGLFCFNKVTRSFGRISKGIEEASVSVQVMQQDELGNLYLGTWGNGLIKLERQANRLSYCSAFGDDNASIRNSIIRTMSFDGTGSLIFNVRDRGLMKYNLTSGKLSVWDAGNVNNDLNNKVVMSMYADPSGIIWIGTIYDGVIKIVSLINSFKHYSTSLDNPAERNGGGVAAIHEDSKGYLWLGTRFGGLFRINRKTQEYTVYKQLPGSVSGLSCNNILSLLEVIQGDKQVIWIGTDGGGLNRLEPATGKFIVYKSQDQLPTGPSSNSVSSIIQYDQDHLLIGTRDRNLGEGLDVFNLRTGKFINLRYNPADSTSLGSNNVLKLFKDKMGTVWVGTRNGGLNKFVIENINAEKPEEIGYFIRYTNNPLDPGSLNNNTVYAIHDDSKNNLWVGTNGGGLSKFDSKQGSFTTGNLHKYLKDNIIYGIIGDENDNLWISTSRGIIVLNLISNEVHSFDKYDGLQEKAFIFGSYFKSTSGEMFFGGIEGCNSFYPDSVKLNLKVPKIVITSLSFSGKKGTTDVTQLTGKSVIASKSIRSPYYQNNFSITFSALDYQMPAKNRYKYKLDGYDQDWIETDASRRYVNYTNLPPGKFIFKVIGSNSDDIWNHEGTSITIYITPPFWRTTTFLVLIIVLFIGIISYIFYVVLQKYRREKMQVELEARLSLQDERKQLRTLIDSMPDHIFIKDRESRFTVANKRVAHVLGTTSENIIGKTDFEFYSSDLAQSFYDDEQTIMRTGKPMINYEEPGHDEHGNRIVFSTTKMPFKNKDGEVIGIVGICRDITQLKRIEKQFRKKSEDLQETNTLLEGRQKEILLQSEELAEQTQRLLMINAELECLNRTKDKFFSIIAHDLRNPFNAIIGFSELLRNDFHEMDNKQKLNVLELINVSSQTAYNLLENLLQWARTQTDKIKFNPENFDLAEIVNSVFDLQGIIARKKGVKLKNEIAPKTLVHADKNMINTVLRNLISNAIKFSNPDGEIVITVNLTDEIVEVIVIDDGVGMSRESLGKLFRIDTYYSTSGTMGESGTGLGLIICKEFVEKNSGRIKAISAEGAGTTLSFTLNPAKLN
jgi:PAS domain S-box-containing protein